MPVEVVNRGGRWYVATDGHRREFPDREAAIRTAENLTEGEPVPVVFERSAHVKAELKMKGG